MRRERVLQNYSHLFDKLDEISHFANEINKWLTVGEESLQFQQLADNLAFEDSMQREDWRTFIGQKNINSCIICRSALKIFIEYRRQGMSLEKLKSKVIELCIRLNIQSKKVCTGVVNLNAPTIVHIIDSRPNLTETTICGVVLESKFCPLNDDEYEWTVNVDKGPRKLIRAEETDETMNIVQITDIHYDPKYEPFGNVYCNEPTCCREGQNDTNVSGKLAGYWGDYNHCDTPWHAVVDVLDHIRATHQNISYLYVTGDIVDHGVWETSHELNTQSINSSYYQIYETFRNVSVYPILGNHEPHPLNLFAPKTITDDEISTRWLYNLLTNLWIDKLGWLPESTRSTILQGGYYTLLAKKGFRIIVLNNNVCYCYNWWIWYQPKDPDGQLQWLANTLLQAEKDGEFVHILAHIPPNSKECQGTWKREYITIIERFAHIITAQFNGHTHNDEIRLFYDSDNDAKIYNVAWNGGSTTAYSDLNPNYKLYIVNRKNYTVRNMENWMYNLTLANENISQRPLWYKSYTFKEEYGLPDLSYDSLNTWFSKLSRDDNDLLIRYYRHFFKHAEPSLGRKCDSKCMRTHMCDIITSLGDREKRCRTFSNFSQPVIDI